MANTIPPVSKVPETTRKSPPMRMFLYAGTVLVLFALVVYFWAQSHKADSSSSQAGDPTSGNDPTQQARAGQTIIGSVNVFPPGQAPSGINRPGGIGAPIVAPGSPAYPTNQPTTGRPVAGGSVPVTNPVQQRVMPRPARSIAQHPAVRSARKAWNNIRSGRLY